MKTQGRNTTNFSDEGTLTIERVGEFILISNDENHCGVDIGMRVRYKFVCVCGPTLDERGFLFDQLSVDRWFQEQRFLRTPWSCEKFAMEAVRKLLDVIHKENKVCDVREASLTLSPEPFKASVRYTHRPKGNVTYKVRNSK